MPSSPNTGSDAARVQLRSVLANYIHAQEPAAPRGFHKWAAPVANQPKPRLLVGDPVTLVVSPCSFLALERQTASFCECVRK
jgi:hypothetical protein